MAYPVIDCATDTSRKLSQLKASGVTGIIRYNDRFSTWKQVHAREAKAIADAGLQLGIVYEHTATPSGEETGNADALYSRRIAPDIGQPAGSAVYFAVDYDASASQTRNQIIPYFRGVQRAFEGSGLRAGVYGSGLVCRLLKAEHLVELTWPTCSTGFTESRTYVASRAWDIWQAVCEHTLFGLDCDLNAVNNPNWGQFTPWGKSPPVPPPIPGPIPPPLHDNFWVQTSLNKYGTTPPLEVDGDIGPLTTAAIRAFQQTHGLVVDGVCGPATTAALAKAAA